MYFESLDTLIHMDGHGVYVWSVYVVATVVVSLLAAIPLRRKRRMLQSVLLELSEPEGEHD